MTEPILPDPAVTADAGLPGGEPSIPALVAEVYEVAPDAERGRILEQLMRPLGVLSLFGIAGGVFANIRFRSGWPEMHVQLDDVHNVRGAQVMALAEHVQQVSVEAVDGLAQTLAASPLASGSAAAAVLVTLLLRRARSRRMRAEGPARSSRASN
jgi:hypothetical protein